MTQRSRVIICVIIAAAIGCAGREARQGTVEFATANLAPGGAGAELAAVRQTTADLAAGVAAIRAEISAHTEATVAAVRDESRRTAETTQKAILAVNRTDNSTHDRWESRLLAAGFVILALSYPIGKLIWITGGKLTPGRRRRDQSGATIP